MATRIYLPSSGSAPVTPSTWNFGAQINPLTFEGVKTKIASAMTSKLEATGTTNPTARAMLRYVIGPLADQTISGSAKGQMRGLESNAGANASLAIAIKIIQPGGADRAVLLAQTAGDSAASPVELLTAGLTNRQFNTAAESTTLTLTSQSATAGDYLVIEIGFRSATGTSRNITLSYGDDHADDLPEDTSTTAANNPWVEFSGNIAFLKVYTPSGGVTFGGSAGVARTLVPGVSGGVTFAGSAATEYAAGTTTYTYQPTGGVTFGGVAGIARTMAPLVSGGVVFAGTAGIARTLVPPVSGGVEFAGVAQVATTRVVEPSGGVTFAGAAPLARTIVAPVSGGVEFAGTGSGQFLPAGGSTTYTYQPVGGVDFAGAAATQYTSGAVPGPAPSQGGGGGTWWRPEPQATIFAYRPVGGPRWTGRAGVSAVFVARHIVQPSGGLGWTGAAGISRTKVYRAGGAAGWRGAGGAEFYSPVNEMMDELSLLALLN